MTRRVEVVQLVEDGWLVKCWAKTAAEAEAIQRACQGVPKPAAFVPFDPPEEPAWPSDATAREYPPNCDGNNTAGDVLAQAQYEAAVDGDDCTSGVCLAVRGAND